MAKAGEGATLEELETALEAAKDEIGDLKEQNDRLYNEVLDLEDRIRQYEDGINADCRWLAKEVLDIVALNHHESNCTHDACKVDMRVAITCPIYLLSVVDDIADLLANYTPKDN